MPTASFKDELVAEMGNLRAFAISLSGSASLADDLVQETLLRAWSKSDKFQPGTSLRAWLFTILRNIYYSNYRKRGREVQDSDGAYARRLIVSGDQESHLDLEDFRKALTKLPAEQREVLTLVGASGLSYEEAAEICDVEIGTIKSRLSRARSKLVELLALEVSAHRSRRKTPRCGGRGDASDTIGSATGPQRRNERARSRRLFDDRARGQFRRCCLVPRPCPVYRMNGTPLRKEPPRERRNRSAPPAGIEDRDREVDGVRPKQRVVQCLAEPDHDRSRLGQHQRPGPSEARDRLPRGAP